MSVSSVNVANDYFRCYNHNSAMISDSVVSECNVNYCDSDYCNDTICTQCHPGFYYHTGPHCEKCYLYCKGCNESQCYSCYTSDCSGDICDHANCVTAGCYGNHNVYCFNCPDGFYWSAGKCWRCNNINCKCAPATNCIGCPPGFHGTSNFCNNHCPSTCVECISSTNCTKCTAGKYGEACEHDCITTCHDGTCDTENGNCREGCLSGQYLSLDDICKPCPNRCNTCSSPRSCFYCTKFYYWGPACQYDCTGCYTSCNRNYGCSSGCDRNYYQAYAVDKNGYVCLRCPGECQDCTSATECDICVLGRWGSACKYNCTGCSKECDKVNGCESRCLSGYYREASENGFVCMGCSHACETCSNATLCQTCTHGRWGNLCQYNCSGCSSDCDVVKGCESGCLPRYYRNSDGSCRKCSVNCIEGHCDRTNGQCTEGCLSGFGAPRCDQGCPNGCLTCAQNNASVCMQCDFGLFGSTCEQTCSDNCKRVGPGFPVCLMTDGSCLNGCENGHWGKHCSLACEPGCLDDVCNETNGVCLIGCKENYYGDTCVNKCDGNLIFVPVCKTDIDEVTTEGAGE